MKTAKLFQTQSLIIILLLFSACSKQNPCNGSNYTPKTFNYLIDDSTKAQIPYTGNETLTFISNQGDTAILKGQGKNNYMKKTTKNSVTSMDCPEYDNYNFEQVYIEYRGANVELNLIDLLLDIDKYKSINFNIKVQSNTSGIYLNESLNYTDSVLINNKYYGGYYLFGTNKILFNKNNGILFINTNNKTWKLNF